MTVMNPVERLIVPALNHLIESESWAAARLRPFAGAELVVELGRFRVALVVDGLGLFRPSSGSHAADVVITMPDDTPARLVTARSTLLQSAKLAGKADFAEALGFVFRNLRWDIEADLARVVGDIPARRLDLLRQHVQAQISEGIRRLSVNVTEYVTLETDTVIAAPAIEAFGQDVNRLRDDLARLEKRIQRLSQG